MASDGRWYPPELHPDVLRPTAVATAEPEVTEASVLEAEAVEPDVAQVEPVLDDTGPPTDPVPVVPAPVAEPATPAGDAAAAEHVAEHVAEPAAESPAASVAPAASSAPGPVAEELTPKERSRRLRRRRRETQPTPEPVAEDAAERESSPVPVETRAERRRQRRRRTGVIAAAVVVLAGAAGAGVALTRSSTTSAPARHRPPTTTATTPTVSGWTAAGVHVVGGPIVAGGHLVVLDTATDGTMALAGLDPRTGKVQWQQPYSPSAIPPGVLVEPVASGTTVLDLAPSAGATDTSVIVRGIDVATGQPAWSAPGPAVVVDAPVVCTAQSFFCVNVTGPGGTSQLEQIDPAKGTVLATVAGPRTQMTSGLYQTQAQPAAFVQVSDAATVLWTKSVASLFGGTQYSPQYGYDFVSAGALDVGTVGLTSVNGTEQLGSLKTVGVTATSGAVAWSAPGALDCFGVIPVAPHFLCRYSGSGSYVNGNLSTTGVTLTLEGLDPATGAVSWSLALSQAQSFTTGNGVPVVDADHVVVPLAGGPSLLDLTSGQHTALPAAAVFWCGQSQQASVHAPSAALSNGQRVAVALFTPCTAQGTPSPGTPAHALPAIGVSVDGLFVWPSATGLMASPVPH
jgi:hypothetical protein